MSRAGARAPPRGAAVIAAGASFVLIAGGLFCALCAGGLTEDGTDKQVAAFSIAAVVFAGAGWLVAGL